MVRAQPRESSSWPVAARSRCPRTGAAPHSGRATAKIVPPGEKATLPSKFSPCSSTVRSFPEATSQIRTPLSIGLYRWLEARSVPSGWNATPTTQCGTARTVRTRARGHVPELEATVVGADRQERAVRREGEDGAPVRFLVENRDRPAGGGIAQDHSAVRRTTRQEPAVGRERHPGHPVFRVLKRAAQPAGGDVPEPNRIRSIRAGQGPAVGREGDSAHGLSVAGKQEPGLSLWPDPRR